MGSSKRFSIQIQHTIDIMNLKTLQRIPTFFQVYGTNCSE
jgi:hypothetical protein